MDAEDETRAPANDLDCSPEEAIRAAEAQYAQWMMTPEWQESNRILLLRLDLKRCEDLIAVVRNPVLDFGENKLAFTMVMHAAVHLCGIKTGVIARWSFMPRSLVESYVTGEQHAGRNMTIPGAGTYDIRRIYLENVIIPLLERKINRVRPRFERLERAFLIRHGMLLDTERFDPTNVTLFNQKRR
jgi:hypothetical protein